MDSKTNDPPSLNEKNATSLPNPVSSPPAASAWNYPSRRIRWRRRFFVVSATLSVLVLWNLVGGDFLDLFAKDVRHSKPSKHSRPCFRDHPEAWPLRAFRNERMKAEEAEKLFLSTPDPASARLTSIEFASAPHLGGSSLDLIQAKRVLAIFQEELNITAPSTYPMFDAGSVESRNATLSITNLTEPTAWIDTYYPILNTPLTRELQILGEDGKPIWDADVEEVGDGADPAGQFAKTVGAWHGLSKDGDVKGKLVYVNYGRKEDYDELRAQGIDLTGTITIARYGGLFRGLKVKAAQEAGAIGALIYSDPRDDGTVTTENGYKPYPEGPARNPDSVQRGSVQFLSLYPGDPSTPGYPAYPNATRSDSDNTPSIPSIPISWTNAKRLLLEIDPQLRFILNGEQSKNTVRLRNSVDTKVTPIWNTMAVIPGHVKSEVVVLGNHRDAWVLGAGDPTSGTAATVEIIKGLGVLLKKGWKPLRTLIIASWDAEEYGLIGSTEYGEDFEEFLRDHVVAYLNVDVATKGPRFRVGGSPTLAHLLRGVAGELPHPTDANRTLWDATHDAGTLKGPSLCHDTVIKTLGLDWQNEERRMKELKEADSTGVFPLGSGSDYTVFLQRIGIASSDEGFGSTYTDPVYHYHSVYDSMRFQELYSDPGFHRHVSIAQHLGLVTLRLLDTPLLPLNTTQYALELGSYLQKVKKEASDNNLTPNFHHLAKWIEHVQKASHHLDQAKIKAAHELEKALADLEKHRKQNAYRRHNKTARCVRVRWRKARNWIKSIFGVSSQDKMVPAISDLPNTAKGGHHLPAPVRRVMKAAQVVVAMNKKLSFFERGFISEEGIKDRDWYRNIVVAPGKWKGYGATTFPALSEAIENKNSTQVEHEIARLSHLLHKLATQLHV